MSRTVHHVGLHVPCMSAYRRDIGITGGGCYRTVDVVWKPRQSSFAASDWNLVLEQGRLTIRLVLVRSVPRGGFLEFRVVLDTAAFQL